jgi:hypothetical protein
MLTKTPMIESRLKRNMNPNWNFMAFKSIRIGLLCTKSPIPNGMLYVKNVFTTLSPTGSIETKLLRYDPIRIPTTTTSSSVENRFSFNGTAMRVSSSGILDWNNQLSLKSDLLSAASGRRPCLQ